MKKHLLTISALLLTGSMYAQAVRNNVEKASDRNQVQNDQATIARDRAEINQFRTYRTQLGDALRDGNVGAAHAHHMKLLGAMESEIAQGQAKIDRSQGELAGARSEVRSDNREVRHDRATGKPVQAADDRQDRRDDLRDKGDDRGDLTELRARNARQREILAVFKAIQVKDNPNAIAALQAKHALLDEFEQSMIRDMGENYEELHEDHKELREDRRETREDRRQR